jgi:N-acetylmuramoyl-L-alanine amidase
LQIAREMKLALLRTLLGVCLLQVSCGYVPAASAARKVSTAMILGREYVRLSDWVRENGLEVHWVKKDETLKVTGKGSSITLTIDSSDADFNGVHLRLLYPLARRDGSPYLSRLDADDTFRPLLNPPKNREGAKVKTICLDPGHGGNQPGYLVQGNQEKKYTLLLAGELQEQLRRAGFKVSLTRTSDKLVELPERPLIAKRRGADLLISLHFNSAPSSPRTVRGTEVYCLTPAGAPSTNARGEGADAGWFPGNRLNDKNMFLAYQIQRSLTRELAVEDRGVHRARFWVLRDAAMPAILIEGGFMSHPVEGKKIFDAGYRKQMAKAIVNGVMSYKRAVEAD